MVSGRNTDFEQARRVERGLILVRWFGCALGVYLVSQTNTGPQPYASRAVLTGGQLIMGALALGNVFVWIATNRAKSYEGMRRIGRWAFALDTLVVFGLAWIFSYDPKGNTWVVIYILPLEGAIRYQLQGALASVALSLVNELAREIYLASRFTQPQPELFIPRYSFQVANVAFRVGLQAIIALVAGFMARSLARQAENAAEQAVRFEEAARREAAARRELAAFNTALLTGVAAEDLDMSLQLMASAIGRDLGFETFSILLREGDELAVKGMYGMPLYKDRVPIGSGVTGTVAEQGSPLMVPDVGKFPAYIMVDPDIRSEMAAPMKIGEELVGVVDVESRQPDGFDQASLAMLARLADQIALVAHSNQLLSQQREIVIRLQQLDQMKSDFVAITSHELRTPLTAIRGFVKTLIRNRDRISDNQVTDFMHIIDRQTERLARLVEDLLLVSRIEAGKIRLAIEEVDIERFLRDTVDSFGPEDRSRLRLEVARNGEAGSVFIDPHRVEQVLRNLVENALKFSGAEAPVSLRASLDNGSVELAVVDGGVGISAEELPTIFDRFHQAGPVLTREAEGAGLGLYITKRLVEAMGGTIDVSSALGEGSTFRVVLPRGSASDESGDELEPESEPAPAAPTAL